MVISPLIWVITIVTLLITPLITTREPPSTGTFWRVLGCSWVGINRVISSVTICIAHIGRLEALPITTHEPRRKSCDAIGMGFRGYDYAHV